MILEPAKFLSQIDFLHRLLLIFSESISINLCYNSSNSNNILSIYNNDKGYEGMRFKLPSTSMCIALTILFAGLTVQITDNLDVFGRNSYVPLILGLSIIAVGVSFFLILRLITKKRSARKNTADG